MENIEKKIVISINSEGGSCDTENLNIVEILGILTFYLNDFIKQTMDREFSTLKAKNQLLKEENAELKKAKG